MDKRRAGYIIFAILILAGFLRLYGLNRGDAISDEVLLAFRAIEMVDFDEGDFQRTPLEWFDSSPGGVPWWTGLSFHDHPPLVFFTQHIFMKVFGENTVAFRLPSVIFGLGSVYLVYLLGALLFSIEAGLFSSLLLAITVNHVYISRIGLQESYVIFFLLLSLYFFFKGGERDKYFIYSGIALGLGLLTKYTVGIVIPVILTYTLIWEREYIKKTKFWAGGLLAFIIFSPVIIYNIEMYRAVGHFDFQISAMVGQKPAEWQVQPGKDIGTLSYRLGIYVPNLIATNSWALLLIFGFSFLYIFKFKVQPYGMGMRFFLVSFAWVVFLMLIIGPQFRFLTMLTPFIALSSGALLYGAYRYVADNSATRWLRLSGVAIFCLLVMFELFYSWNSQISLYPRGEMYTLWSKLRYENYNWGYRELGYFMEKELKDKAPALTFDPKYKFLSEIRDKAVTRSIDSGAEPYSALFVYGGNFDKGGKLWTLDRLHIFHGWPIISVPVYYQMLEENGSDFFEKSGFEKLYFIFSKNKIPDDRDRALSEGGDKIPIYDSRGREAFDVFVRPI